jgi:hypothetical protein
MSQQPLSDRLAVSPRIQLAIDDDSRTVFIVPYGNAFLWVVAWLCTDGDYEDSNVIQVDLYSDKLCTALIAEEVEWKNLADLDAVFLDIRTQQFERDDRARRSYARLEARLSPNGLERLMADLRKPETREDAERMAAAQVERMLGVRS